MLRKSRERNNLLYSVIDYIILFLTLVYVFTSSNSIDFLHNTGYLIIFLSLYLCYKVRKNEKILLLFSIIGFINISVAVSDNLLLGLHVADWQIPLRETMYNSFTSKSILLFISVLNVAISHHWLENKAVNLKKFNIKQKYNPILVVIGIISLFYILFFGYDLNVLSANVYVSNDNPLIEYAIVIYLVVWMYSGKSSIINFILHLYSISYILISMSFGDRSAGFLMIIIYYLLFINQKHELTLKQILILTVSAVLFSNIIAEVRHSGSNTFLEVIDNALQRGMYSDTVSYSYYASVTLTATHHIENNFMVFIEYVLSWIGLGETNNLSYYVSNNYLHNVGGGMYPAYFYFGMGYVGVLLSSAILGLILRSSYSRKGFLAQVYQLLIPTFAIRWYLYGPTTFYRSIFVVSTLFIFACIFFHKVLMEVILKPSKSK